MPTAPLAERTDQIKPSSIREVVARVAEATRQGRKVINFSAGRPDFDTPAHIKAAAGRALDDGWVHYAPTIGLESLREAVALRLNHDFGLEIEPGRVIITLGSSEAMFVSLQTILNPGDEVLAPDPMYVYYGGWAALGGAGLVPVPLTAADGFRLTAERLRPRLSPRTKALIINSPHNPTGQVFDEADLRDVAALAVENDFFVICDEIYNYQLYEGARHFPIASAPGMAERTLMIGSLSKTYAMDGWRVGYLIAPEPVFGRALKMHQYTVSCANTFVQHGAAAALAGPQDCVGEMLAELDRRRLLLMGRLDEMAVPYVRPRGAFYVFPDISRFGLSAGEFSDFLFTEAGVAVVPGDAFGPGGRGHVRMAYCLAYEEMERGLDQMAAALEKL